MARARAPHIVAAAAALSVLLTFSVNQATAQPVDTGPPPIGHVLKEMPRDLWHFFSWDTAVVLGIGAGAAATGHIWDDDLADEIETNVSLNNTMQPGHTYGAFTVQVLIGTGMMVYSGFRFVRLAHEAGLPIAIVNRGRTRGDDLAELKIEGDVGATLLDAIRLVV